jgi:hypothetical protein
MQSLGLGKHTVLWIIVWCRNFFLYVNSKVWWHYATLLNILLLLKFIRTIQSHILSSFIICRGPSSCTVSSSLLRSAREAFWGAEPRNELGPALQLQQADAPPSDVRSTLTKLRRTLLSYAAQLSYAAP